jgi:uncharacterized membrane protein
VPRRDMDLPLAPVIILIEFGGSVAIVGAVLRALWALARTGSIDRARLLVIDGILWGLGFKLAATLLKTLDLHSWQQILIFALILALRTLVKQVALWQRRHLVP